MNETQNSYYQSEGSRVGPLGKPVARLVTVNLSNGPQSRLEIPLPFSIESIYVARIDFPGITTPRLYFGDPDQVEPMLIYQGNTIDVFTDRLFVTYAAGPTTGGAIYPPLGTLNPAVYDVLLLQVSCDRRYYRHR